MKLLRSSGCLALFLSYCIFAFDSLKATSLYASDTQQISSLDQKFQSVCPASTPLVSPLASSFSQSTSYCQSAKSSIAAAQANSALWKVWTAVTSLCAVSCALSSTPLIGNQWLCPAVDLAATITDGVMLKNFTSILTGIGGIAGGVMVNQLSRSQKKEPVSSSSPQEKEGPQKQRRTWGACVIALTTAYQAYAKHAEMKNAIRSATANVNSAESLARSSGTALTSESVPSSPSSVGTSGGHLRFKNGIPLSAQNPTTTNPCNNASQLGSTVQCALASDTRVPSVVGQTLFQKQLQELTRTPLDSYFKQLQDPTSGILSTVGAGFPSAPLAELQGTLKQLEAQAASASKASIDKTPSLSLSQLPAAASTYLGGGKKTSTSQDSFDASLNQLLQKMMPQSPQEKDTPSSPLEILFSTPFSTSNANAERLENVLSLFQKISARYVFLRYQQKLDFPEIPPISLPLDPHSKEGTAPHDPR